MLDEYAPKLLSIKSFHRALAGNPHEYSLKSCFGKARCPLQGIFRQPTSQLAFSLVHSIFQYKVPKLQTLNAEQILEVRDYIKDTKEGFTYYINQMTDDIEQRIKSGNLTEMEAAQKTLERKILPLYEEFRRQLTAKKTGYWSNISSPAVDFVMNATPWSLKFYVDLIKLACSWLKITAKEEEVLLTNQSQAFQFIATLEKKVH